VRILLTISIKGFIKHMVISNRRPISGQNSLFLLKALGDKLYTYRKELIIKFKLDTIIKDINIQNN